MMKKVWALALGLSLLGSGSAWAHGSELAAAAPSSKPVSIASGHSANEGLSVLINGVPVQSPANHLNKEGKAYISVEAFAEIAGKPVEIGKDGLTVTFNGKSIGEIEKVGGTSTAWVRDLADAAGAQKVNWDGASQEVYVLLLPEGTIQLDPAVVPKMGEHWANPQAGELPIGPIYGVYNGKLVFLEYMIDQKDFTEGKNHANLKGMKGVPMPSVVQTDIEFQAKGHPGFEIPHYDIHMYFISDEEQEAIK